MRERLEIEAAVVARNRNHRAVASVVSNALDEIEWECVATNPGLWARMKMVAARMQDAEEVEQEYDA